MAISKISPAELRLIATQALAEWCDECWAQLREQLDADDSADSSIEECA